MFEYCKRSKNSIGTTIGSFLSHEVKWCDDLGALLPPEVINSWDRVYLAKRYTEEYFCNPRYIENYSSIGGVENRDKFIEEVAIKIDEFIPKRYFVKYHQITKDGSYIEGSKKGKEFISKDEHEETKKIVYKYSCNDDKAKRVFTYYVTEKQLRYLTYLAEESGYIVKNADSLECSMASKLISFLLGELDEVENMFDYIEYE